MLLLSTTLLTWLSLAIEMSSFSFYIALKISVCCLNFPLSWASSPSQKTVLLFTLLPLLRIFFLSPAPPLKYSWNSWNGYFSLRGTTRPILYMIIRVYIWTDFMTLVLFNILPLWSEIGDRRNHPAFSWLDRLSRRQRNPTVIISWSGGKGKEMFSLNKLFMFLNAHSFVIYHLSPLIWLCYNYFRLITT